MSITTPATRHSIQVITATLALIFAATTTAAPPGDPSASEPSARRPAEHPGFVTPDERTGPIDKTNRTRRDDTSAILVAGNGIYDVYVDDFLGVWTATTGVDHPAGPGLNVLYGNGFPGTSNTTLCSYITSTDYVTGGAGFGCVDLTGVAGPPAVGLIFNDVTIVGFNLVWILFDGPNVIGFEQMVVVVGPVDGSQTVDNTVIRETHLVTNLAGPTYAFGLRKHWDWQIGGDDGPWLGDCLTPALACDRSVNLTPDGSLDGPYPDSYVINEDPAGSQCVPGVTPNNPVGCGGNPLYLVAGTIAGSTALNPPPDPPELFHFNSWPAVINDCWLPALFDNATCPGGDTTAAYFYGLTPATAITITEFETRLFTQYVVAGEDSCPEVIDPDPPTGPDRVSGTEKGSVLIFSKVEIRWDAAGNVIQDTFLDITNDWDDDTGVQMYFVNGDPPLPADGGERAHPGWNSTDVKVTLTADQPAYWSALTGQPGPGGAGVSPFTILDPSFDPLAQGRPALDGTGDRVMRGFVYAWACDVDGCQVAWDQLKGDATIVHYDDGYAWEYNAWAFQSVGNLAPGTRVGPCGTINLDGVDFVAPYALLLLDFYASGSTPFTGGNPLQVISVDTDLTLHPVDVDFRQDGIGPLTTKATFTVWNENETQFTGLHRCITCWDQTLLSQYAAQANHFLLQNLQTDKGKARIDGLESALCSSNCCIDRADPGDHAGCASVDCQELVCAVDQSCCTDEWDGDCVWIAIDLCAECDSFNLDTPLLGVAAKHLIGPTGPTAAGGLNLVGMGTEDTLIFYDPVPLNPPPPAGD